jgi:hypothetical protein
MQNQCGVDLAFYVHVEIRARHLWNFARRLWLFTAHTRTHRQTQTHMEQGTQGTSTCVLLSLLYTSKFRLYTAQTPST